MECFWILFSFVHSILSPKPKIPFVVYLATSFNVKQVKLGDPVTLLCKGQQKKDYPGRVEWSTSDQMVAQYSAGTFKPGRGFEYRVHLPDNGTLKKGNFSLTISPTVYSDYDTYECWYENEHLNSWTLKIMTSLPATYVMLGDAATLPCYARINRNTPESDITLQWTKGDEIVLSIKNGILRKFKNFQQRVTVTPSEIRKGNISLHFSETYLSDNGTYTCQMDNTVKHVTLQLTGIVMKMKSLSQDNTSCSWTSTLNSTTY
ncbi:hypothetical protein P4O66_006893 [Electrophorus voltai]|uniref:Ig-like domain-containing protein n=1 Tax=Electrophorus voltai TaxID=2609070 RepID=A0AAD9DZE5_9TELE|nr:hypothetical protein P4O66_006893 [Electrophorus voltai]